MTTTAAAPAQRSTLGTWLRRLGWVLLGLLVILVALGAFVWSQFDAQRVQGLVVDWVRQHHQRELRLDAPLELGVFPRLQVRVQRATLSEHASKDTFATVQDATLSVEVMPLLDGRMVVDRIAAKGVHLALKRDAQGRMNIDDLLQQPDEPAETPDAKKGKPLRFEASGLDLEDVVLRVDDRQGKLAGELKLERLKTGRLSDGATTPVQVALVADLSEPRARLGASGSAQARFSRDTGAWAIEDFKLNLQGDLPQAQGLKAEASGKSAAFDSASRQIDLKALKLLLSGKTAAVALADSRIELDAARAAADFSHGSAQNLRLDLAGSQGGQPFKLKGGWASLEASRPLPPAPEAPGMMAKPAPAAKGVADGGLGNWSVKAAPTALEFSWGTAGATQASGRFNAGAAEGRLGDLRIRDLKLEAQGRAAAQTFNATLTGQARVDGQRPNVQLDGLQLQATLQAPSQPELKVQATGSAAYDGGEAAHTVWKLDGQANGQKLSTEGQLRLAASGPDATVNARMDALDLDRFMPPPAAPAREAAPAASAPAGDGRIDLSTLNTKARARVSLQAGSLKFRQHQLSQVKLVAALTPGVLRLESLDAQGYGGRLQASGSAAAQGPAFAVKASGQGLNVLTLLKTFTGKDTLEGTGNISVDVRTAGANTDALRLHLDGTARAELRDGAVRGFNLAKMLRQAKSALNMKSDESQQASSSEKTDFSELSASFAIKDGIAHNEDLQAKSPFLRVTGAGDIDIGRATLNYEVKPTVTADSTGQGGADLAQLKGLTVPVKLSGPLTAMQWKVKWSEVAASAITAKTRSKLEDQLKNKLGIGESKPPADSASGAQPNKKKSTEDQLKKALKGLF